MLWVSQDFLSGAAGGLSRSVPSQEYPSFSLTLAPLASMPPPDHWVLPNLQSKFLGCRLGAFPSMPSEAAGLPRSQKPQRSRGHRAIATLDGNSGRFPVRLSQEPCLSFLVMSVSCNSRFCPELCPEAPSHCPPLAETCLLWEERASTFLSLPQPFRASYLAPAPLPAQSL